MSKLMWLSFAGDEGHRGVAIVMVTDEEIAEAKDIIDQMFPHHVEGIEIVAAAARKASKLGINPGGQVMAIEMDLAKIPPDCIYRLMTKDEVIERRLGD